MFKVIRTYPAPPSLATKKNYGGDDVLKSLKDCFHSKCYLCETKEPLDINIEHFIPHGNDEHLKFEWTNLYLACSRCNNIKLARKEPLLDCCNADFDISDLIKILPPISPFAGNMILEPLSNDPFTLNTAALLNDIYNNENTVNKQMTATFLRKRIYFETGKVSKYMRDYLEEETSEEEKESLLNKINNLTKSSAPYSAITKHLVLSDSFFSKLIFKD